VAIGADPVSPDEGLAHRLNGKTEALASVFKDVYTHHFGQGIEAFQLGMFGGDLDTKLVTEAQRGRCKDLHASAGQVLTNALHCLTALHEGDRRIDLHADEIAFLAVIPFLLEHIFVPKMMKVIAPHGSEVARQTRRHDEPAWNVLNDGVQSKLKN
jgi:hypothetical protein